jgi:hypothetical protein
MSDKKPVGAVRRRPHNFQPYFKSCKNGASLAWPVCRHCGLVLLRNERTAELARKGCWLYDDEIGTAHATG